MCYIAIIIAHQIGFVKHFSAEAFLEGPLPGNDAILVFLHKLKG